MKRPNLDDHGNTFQYSGYQDKYIDQLEDENKALKKELQSERIKALSQAEQADEVREHNKELVNLIQGNLNDAYDGNFVLQEFIEESATLLNIK